jgi:NitT/TauT family transport system substrate-binding protein
MTTVRIMALRHSAFYSPLLMTMAGGYLRDEGLDCTYDVATPQRTIPASLADGSCHVAQSAVAVGFAGLERGERGDIVHFAQINTRDGFFVAGRRPEPDFTWDRLRGKRVLVDHLFQPLAMLRYALHRHGVELNEMTVIDAGDVAAIDRAFRNGDGDYVHQQGPAPQQLEHDGIAHVVASVGAAVGPVAFSSLCATRAWLETDMARAFARAYARARDCTRAAPAAELAARMTDANFFPGIERGVLERTIAAYQQLGCWSGGVAIEPETYERLLDVFQYNGLITRRHAFRELIVAPP